MSTAVSTATDRRRNTGPENSTRPLLEPSLASTRKREGTLDSNLMRRDGRYPEQVRPISTSFEGGGPPPSHPSMSPLTLLLPLLPCM